MRFLVDIALSPELARFLQERGHDAVHAGALGLWKATDASILSVGIAEQRIVVTADLDFARLLALGGEVCPGLVLFRGGNFSAEQVELLMARALAAIPEGGFAGSLITIEVHRIRRRPLPL